jgi:hypothetical protein
MARLAKMEKPVMATMSSKEAAITTVEGMPARPASQKRTLLAGLPVRLPAVYAEARHHGRGVACTHNEQQKQS